MADIDLDCKAISCPMPIVRIAKAVKTMSPGQTLKVEATDPSFQADVEAWTRRTGNELLSFTVRDDIYVAVIQIKG